MPLANEIGASWGRSSTDVLPVPADGLRLRARGARRDGSGLAVVSMLAMRRSQVCGSGSNLPGDSAPRRPRAEAPSGKLLGRPGMRFLALRYLASQLPEKLSRRLRRCLASYRKTSHSTGSSTTGPSISGRRERFGKKSPNCVFFLSGFLALDSATQIRSSQDEHRSSSAGTPGIGRSATPRHCGYNEDYPADGATLDLPCGIQLTFRLPKEMDDVTIG
jgi:hypothetical protein